MKWLLLCLCLAATPPLLAVTGRVRMVNGWAIDGEITIDPKVGLVITNADIGATNLALSSVASVQFNLSFQNDTNRTTTLSAALPAGWTNQDVGPVLVPGKAQFEGGAFVLRGTGARIWAAEPDEFHFAYRRFTGNGQMTARVTRADTAMAGIMFRPSLDAHSQFVLQAITPGPEGLVFRSRREPAHRELVHSQGDWLNRDEIKPPCWLKLIRKEKRFSAYKSEDDGITWQPIYDSPVEWERSIFAGLFVMGGESNALKQATFTDVIVEDEIDDRAKSQKGPSRLQVFLNDGSVLTAESVSADHTRMKIIFEKRDYSASLYAVARLIFRPVPERLAGELVAGRKGVLLNTGDFFEGDLRLIDKDQVQVASILFGPRTFPLDKVLAVTLSDSIELPAKYLVRTQDGSLIRAKEISASRDGLVAEELKLGPLKLPLAQLSELRLAGAGNY